MTTSLSQNQNEYNSSIIFTHPGNEDGTSDSAVNGVTLPNSYIGEGKIYLFDWQVSVSTEDYTHIATAVFYTSPNSVFRSVGANAVFIDTYYYQVQPTLYVQLFGFGGTDPFFTGDPQVGITFSVNNADNVIKAIIKGMSINIPTIWKIKSRLVPSL